MHFLHWYACIFCLHQIYYQLVTSAFTRSTLHSLLFLSPNQFGTDSCFCQIFSTLTTSAFARSAQHSLILLSSDLFDAHSFCFHHINLTLTPVVVRFFQCSLLLCSPNILATHSYFFQMCLMLSPSTFTRSISWIVTYFVTLSFLNNIQYFLILYSHV
jgi:hypothetical protein